MTLQQMEYIVAVYRLRHFAKAAEHCGVTQPTLSAMIQKLEQELGVKLFERSSQQVVPTAIGRLVVEQAWRVISRARKIKDIVEEERNALSGVFRIGILPTIAPYLLPRFFTRLMEEYPDIDFRVSEMKTADCKKALARGEIDVAIIVSLGEIEGMEQDSLYFEQFIAYVSESDSLFQSKSIRSADLPGHFLWLLDEGHCFRDQLVKFCNIKSACDSKLTYSLGSIETFMRMVEAGQGITFIPELALDQLTESQKRLVRPFAIPIPTREVVLLTTKTFVRKGIKQMMINEIRDSVPQRMLKMNNTDQRV
ncbi:MAG: hydrogen peroxide-inducible genes activator [Prevotellaceae bacterium]|nr:hydrogen peroxide-inducible genes activator [Prevotellaceae bacterium]MDD5992139.1 hydrogen peroxide-inducible genes activator [Prevotellaceae bacterium]MDD6009448.1 hydrogen peroxide-inducible genes activator [Prevotellaceae bacterium]